MAVSYNGLWKLLIDKNMKKVDMMNQVGISSSTVAKMTNGELVSMKVLEKICEKLDCDFGDIVHYERKSQGGCVHVPGNKGWWTIMEYSAGLTSKLFWLQESRKTAAYILEGLSKTDIRKIAWEENIYQVKAEYRAYEVLNGTYRRVSALPEAVLQAFINSDGQQIIF